jgi:peptide chain release factor 3
MLLGAVGQLQFDVMMYRLLNEYGAEPSMEPAPFKNILWFDTGVTKDVFGNEFLGTGVKLAYDCCGHLVVLFPGKWAMDYFVEEHSDMTFHNVSPRDKKTPAGK